MKGRRKKKPEAYTVRSYREKAQSPGLISSHVKIKETDLHIQSDIEVKRRVEELVFECRLQLEEHIIRYPKFFVALSPMPVDFTSPPLIREMYDAARRADVGPMAAVAGAVAEYVGKKLLDEGVKEIIIENGGDIFISRSEKTRISIFAGESPLSGKVGLELTPPMPLGICTSSGTIGHSLSLGEADSVTVLSRSTLIADAAATRLGNEVGGDNSTREGIDKALNIGMEIDGVLGVVIICDDLLGAMGEVKLIKTQ